MKIKIKMKKHERNRKITCTKHNNDNNIIKIKN